MSDEPNPWDEAPYVCPGCHAVGGERCAGDCPDAAIERKDEWQRMYGDSGYSYDSDDVLREVDELFDYPDTEPAPDDGGDDVVQAIAILEAALDRSSLVQTEPLPLLLRSEASVGGLLAHIDVMDAALLASSGHPGARSCVWCRELVVDDFDHDFCEPEAPTEVMRRPARPREMFN